MDVENNIAKAKDLYFSGIKDAEAISKGINVNKSEILVLIEYNWSLVNSPILLEFSDFDNDICLLISERESLEWLNETSENLVQEYFKLRDKLESQKKKNIVLDQKVSILNLQQNHAAKHRKELYSKLKVRAHYVKKKVVQNNNLKTFPIEFNLKTDDNIELMADEIRQFIDKFNKSFDLKPNIDKSKINKKIKEMYIASLNNDKEKAYKLAKKIYHYPLSSVQEEGKAMYIICTACRSLEKYDESYEIGSRLKYKLHLLEYNQVILYYISMMTSCYNLYLQRKEEYLLGEAEEYLKLCEKYTTPETEESIKISSELIFRAKGGDSETKSNNSTGCFIATASYGTPLANEVIFLKDFRDTILSKYSFGRYFINIYYKTSPPIARTISKSELLKNITKVLLIKPLIRSITYFGGKHK